MNDTYGQMRNKNYQDGYDEEDRQDSNLKKKNKKQKILNNSNIVYIQGG